ncbi:type III secretion system stalk subunit SctO [Pseudooceanicola aestuarii]|uniref:type III secretion system stalk subunit SctO n=1 Tax=Pseudooceanicola aestuarii TaxID=2697319 RepID=UPI0013D478AD|nr:YscO family type III secretion system apparatus protein [Pseudooceanicola aestuarii]
MIRQFRMLERVKKLREDKALRALMAARAQLAEAETRHQALIAEVTQSAATLPDRERAIFDRILQQVVGMGAVDDAKDEVLHLLAEHQKLIDRRDRAGDRVIRAREAVTAAQAELKRKQQEVEKIGTLTEDLAAELAEAQIAAEEAEIEDLFSRPRPAPTPVGAPS